MLACIFKAVSLFYFPAGLSVLGGLGAPSIEGLVSLIYDIYNNLKILN